MTVESWILSRQPAPPASLLLSIRVAIAAAGVQHSDDVVGGSRHAALQLLGHIIVNSDNSRPTAVRLLAADALLTYSCEAASAEPGQLDAQAAECIRAVLSTLDGSQSALDGGQPVWSGT
jgi:hypothetical protein